MENTKYNVNENGEFYLSPSEKNNISRDLTKLRVLKCSLLNCLTIFSLYLEKTVAPPLQLKLVTYIYYQN